MGELVTHNTEEAEVVVAVFAPARRSIVVRSLRRVVFMAGVVAAGWWASPWIGQSLADMGVSGAQPRGWIVGIGVAGVLLKVCYESLLQASRKYTLTDRRMVATTGVFRRTSVEIPLDRVQQVVLDRKVLERLAGLGTLCVTSAGSQMIDLAWVMVKRPGERLAQVREALDGASVKVRMVETPSVRLVAERVGAGAREKLQKADKAREQMERLREARGAKKDEPVAPRLWGASESPMVIGLAGGIGAGKSEVAKTLAGLGALVTDSDKEAKSALERPEVRAKLVEWWGPDVVSKYGGTDRKAIAEIVFRDPAERARLEGLIHPLVKATRGEMIARAKAAGVSAVVIDAPLLYEAGLERECDAVMFVDAPREARVARVKATRGWDEGELMRREKAQLPLEEKKRRADVVVNNTGKLDELKGEVARAYGELLRGRGRGEGSENKGKP